MEDFEILEKGPDYFVAEADGEKYMVEDMGQKKEGLYAMRVGDSDTVYTDDKVDRTSDTVRILEREVEEASYEEVAEKVMAKHLGDSGLEFDLDPNNLESSESTEEGGEMAAENRFGLDQYH